MQRMRVATELGMFTREGESIIFNAENVNPLYFPKGGDLAYTVLSELRALGPISSPPLGVCSQKLFDSFCDHSIVVPDLDEHGCSCKRAIEPNSKLKSASKSLYLLLSQSCNQACIYCLNGVETYQKKENIRMPDEVAFRAIKQTLDAIREGGKLEIVFFGGEPLMNWPLAKKIIDYCETPGTAAKRNIKVHYHFTTNLTIFPHDLVAVAQRHNVTFLVDIDGPREIHDRTRPLVSGKGSFDRTVANVKKLQNAGIGVALRATITKHNHHRMLDVVSMHKELGGVSSAVVPLNPINSDESPYPIEMCPDPESYSAGLREILRSDIWPPESLFPFSQYLGRLKKGFRHNWGCGAPWGNTPTVKADGKMFSCIYLVGIKKFEIGDVSHGDFPRADVVSMMLGVTDTAKIAGCANCKIRHLCGGGCPVGQFTIAGNSRVPDEIKEYSRRMSCVTATVVIEELIWSLAKKRRNEYAIC